MATDYKIPVITLSTPPVKGDTIQFDGTNWVIVPAGTINPTNLLQNGDFESWSVGTSVAPDGWTQNGGASAQESTIIKLGTYSYKLTRSGSNAYLYQNIHEKRGIAYWKGRKITFGCWVYATVASRVKIAINDGTVSYSSNHTGDSTWQWLTVTHIVDASATAVAVYLGVEDGNTSAYFDGAMCVEGESVFAFSDKPITTPIINTTNSSALEIDQNAVLAAGHYGLFIFSDVSQVNDSLVYIVQHGDGSNKPALNVTNNGTGSCLYIEQNGVLNANAGLSIYSNAIQIYSDLFYIAQDHASSTARVACISNDGTGTGLLVGQNGVLATGQYGLYVYSNAAQVNASLAYISMDNASSTQQALQIDNLGTGHALYINQSGVLSSGHAGLYLYSNAVSSVGMLFAVVEDNASNSQTVAMINSDGTGRVLDIEINGVLATGQHGLYIYSNAIQVNSVLFFINQDNASATAQAAYIDNDGTGCALQIKQDGNLASAQYALYIDNNGTPADGATFCIRFDGCAVTGTAAAVFTANKGITSHTALVGWLSVNIDGTQRFIPYW